jgi:hypothetical protein
VISVEPKARLITLTETLIIRDITKTEFNKYFIHTVALHLTAGVLILVLIFASLDQFTTGKPVSDITFNVYNGEGFYSHPDVISPAFLGPPYTFTKSHLPSPNFGHKGFA